MRAAIIALFVIAPLIAVPYVMMSESASKTQTLTLTYVEGTSFDIASKNGRIKITVDPARSDIVVTAKMTAKAQSKEKAEIRLQDMEVDVKDVQGVLKIRPVYPDGDSSRCSCSFEIVTPGGAIGNLKSSNGDLFVAGLSGPGRLKTSNGKITVKNSGSGKLDLTSSNGAIAVEGASGHVAADTSNGKVTVSFAKDAREGFDLNTSNGSVTVRLSRTMGGVIEAKTSNGRVKVENTEFADDIAIKKSKGRIKLSASGPQSKIDTSNGSVRIELR